MRSRFEKIRLRFQLSVLVQLALIGVTLFAAIWAMWIARLPAVSAVSALALAAEVTTLLVFVSAQHRKLERFLDTLAVDDLSMRMAEDGWDRPLAQAANHIIGTVRDARMKTEAQANYLNALVKHVPVAILSYRHGGEIALQNNAARRLFQMPHLSTLEDLAVFGAHLPKALAELEPGQCRLIRAAHDEHLLELKVSATEIRISGEDGSDIQMLLAIENIHSELDDREIAAWRDLIRVLTHEIMNSVTPIASLARTVDGLIEDLRESGTTGDTLDDMHEAVTTIAKRSDGLQQFVDGYRRLTGVVRPQLGEIEAAELLAEAERLCADELGEQGIGWTVNVDPLSLKISADGPLIQQVLINLIRNAAHALINQPDPRITLQARLAHGRVQISVTDNGCGISEEDLPQIFIPFFTTKEDGTGVGMTLARQILAAHGGTVTVRSKPQHGTTVTLTL
jgi:nitrogen fixation/metabolism regulation signal transduction histidine kinase